MLSKRCKTTPTANTTTTSIGNSPKVPAIVARLSTCPSFQDSYPPSYLLVHSSTHPFFHRPILLTLSREMK